jgi:uncharacterized cysteine cluster protein YcgN (CxxCxxCC family)
MEKTVNVPKRTCGDCTKCCEGWLHGVAHGERFYRGKPCHFVEIGKGCTIYENRPIDPCITYKCEWLTNDDFPMWMKPSLSNVLVTKKTGKIEHYQAIEAVSKMDSAVLNWLILWAIRTGNNLTYFVDGGPNRIGSQEFVTAKDL